MSLTFPILLSDFYSVVKSDNEIGKVNDRKKSDNEIGKFWNRKKSSYRRTGPMYWLGNSSFVLGLFWCTKTLIFFVALQLHFNWMQNSEVFLLWEVTYWIGNSSLGTLIQDVQQKIILHVLYTMRTNLPKLLDLLISCICSLNFSLEFFIMILFVTNQLNISKF